MENKFSFHNHSIFSNDRFLKNETPYVILKAIKSEKVRYLAVTDARNDIFFDFIIKNRHKYENFCKIEPVNNAIVRLIYDNWQSYLLRGMEKHDFNGHLLIIGTNEKIEYKSRYSIKDWIDFAHDNGGLCGAPHPVLRFVGGIGENILIKYADKLDFIESFNAQLVFNKKANRRAKELSERYNIPGIASSDSHNHRNIARAYFYTEEEIKPDMSSIKTLIQQGRFKNKERYISYADLIKTYILGRI